MKIHPIMSLFSSARLPVLMKAMRRRIALQNTSCEFHRKVSLVLRSFGSARASSRRFSLDRYIVAMACAVFLTSLGTASAQLAPTYKALGSEPLEKYDNP